MLIGTTAIAKLVRLTKRKKIVQGGTYAAKTYSILPILIDKAILNPNKKITIVAESIPALKQGAISNFKDIMMEGGRWVQDSWNSTDRKYSFNNRSCIEFHSFDSVGKAQAAGKRTDLFINEAYHINFDIADALMMRTTEDIWLDYNPIASFWAHTEIAPQPDAEMIILKYTDNEALPDTILQELLLKIEKGKTSEYWANWCRVYIDGEIGSMQGCVFSNWRTIKELPIEAKLIRHGLDFGYANDPMACISIYQYNNDIVVVENFYKTHMGVSELVNELKKLERKDIVCDNSQPMLIAELCKAGLPAIPCIKGKDSIELGIAQLQEVNILVPESSLNLIKEFRNYTRSKDTNEPIDNYNHGIDGIRYAYFKNKKAPMSASSF